MVTIAQQIKSMSQYGAGSNPMVFEDYRTPMRRRMLIDAKAALLEAHDAPWPVVASLSHKPISEWPTVARERVRS